MAEDEEQAERDRLVELRRKLEAQGMSMEQAMRLALAMGDRKKLTDWLVRDLENDTPEARVEFVKRFLELSGMDIYDLLGDEDDDDEGHEPQAH